MRRTIWANLFALAAVLTGTEARAAGDWGLHTGDTLRGGDLMLYGELGWPDVAFGLQYSLSPKVDIGGRLSLLYGYESTVYTDLGMGLRVPVRVSLTKRPKLSALLHIDPGFKLYGNGYYGRYSRFRYCGSYYYCRDSVTVGAQLPVGVEFGIHLTADATVELGLDVPMDFVFPGGGVPFVIAPLAGAGFEYHTDDHLGIGFNTRFGPTIFVGNGGGVDFGFVAQLCLAYRI